MDYDKIMNKHDEFEKTSKVVSETESVVECRTYIEDEDVTLNNDEKTKTVERQVEGKLAEDIRKRIKAAPDAVVLITEVETLWWLSEVTSEMVYKTTIKCGGVEKKFSRDAGYQNFEALLTWLDEDPASPIGGEVE